MGGNYIQTGFTNPTNSIPGADGKFIVANPFASLAAARLNNTLRGISEYIHTPFFEPSQSVLMNGVYVVQDPIAAFNAAGFPPGPLSGLGLPIPRSPYLPITKPRFPILPAPRIPVFTSGLGDPYSGFDPSDELVPSPNVVDPATLLPALDFNANLVPAGSVNPDGTVNYGTFTSTGTPQSILDILTTPVNTIAVPTTDPLTNMPIVATLPGNWQYNQNTGVFQPGPGGADRGGPIPAPQPSFSAWLGQPVAAGIPVSRGMALAGAAVVVFGMGLLKPSRRR